MRNYTHELIKPRAAFGVALIHFVNYYERVGVSYFLGDYLRLLGAFAVPTFFILSGYYYKHNIKSFWSTVRKT